MEEEIKFNEAYNCYVSKRNNNKKSMPTKREDNGYYVIRDGNNVLRRIHRMVADTFIPNPNPGLMTDVNHKDGDKSNNTISNLEQCTRSQNIKHAYDTGLRKQPSGEDSLNAKITLKQAQWIYDNYRVINGKSNGPELAKQFGVRPTTIRTIITGKTGDGRIQWKDVIRNRKIPKLSCTGGSRKVAQIDLTTGGVIKIFNSIKEARQEVPKGNISRCASGEGKSAGGYGWRYLDEQNRLFILVKK